MAKNKTINMVKSQVIYKDYSKDAERTALVSGENLSHMFGKIARWYTDISWVGHTHTEANITDFGTYAGASTKGGAATSANKLNIGSADIGSETKPVYFSYLTGKPVACTYSLNASVPANAVFTDINVKQSPSTADESREVLFAGNTGNTETTGTVGKSNKLYFNPSTGALTATSFSGSMAASNLTGTIDAGRLPTTAVTAGSYGPAAGGTLTYGGTFDVPYVTVDKYGRLTAGSTKTFTMPAQYVHPSYTAKSSGLYKITVDATGHVSGTAAVTASDLPSHTHPYLPDTTKYAGSSSAGGAATSANKLNIGSSNIGNATTPVYFDATTGLPVALNYTIEKSVPADAKFTDTVYTHPSYTAKASGLYKITVDSLGHVSATSAVTGSDLPSHSHALSLAADSGTSSIALSANTKYKLTAGGSTYVFTTPADTNTTYSAGTGLALDGTTFNLYMPRVTKDCNEALPGINKVKFEEFSNSSTNTPSAQWYHITTMEGEDSRYATQLALGMTTTRLFYRNYSSSSWSAWKEVSFSDHTHNYIPNTAAGLSAAITLLDTGNSVPVDDCYYITQTNDAANNTYYRRKHSILWSYIKGKADSVYAPISHTHNYAGSSSAGGAALSVSTKGDDVVLGTANSSTNDSGDIVFLYGNGSEKMRIWTNNDYSAKSGPLFRIYDTSGTMLYNGTLVLGDGTGASGTWNITATSATTASKLSTNAGGQIDPVYFSNGVPVKCKTVGDNGYFTNVAIIASDGVMEIGKYIDMHLSNGSSNDYDYRLTNTSTSSIEFASREANNTLKLYAPSGYTRLSFQTAESNKAYTASGITVYPLTTSGSTMVVETGGNMIVGGGEAASALYTNDFDNCKTQEKESLYLAADASILFVSNTQTFANRTCMVWESLGCLRPLSNNTLSIGRADYYWNKAYIKLIYGGSNGSWIMGRDNAVVINNTVPAGDSYAPVIAVKTNLGSWTVGSLGSSSKTTEHLYFSYTTDANYNAGTNASNNYYLTSGGWFSGTAAKADKWTTARTITIGSTGKSVDGSGDVSWSLSEIGAAASSHTHSYLPLAGGTMTGDITFTAVTSTSYPATSCKLYWTGSTDWAKIYYSVTASDAGKLVLDIGDDTNTQIAFAYNGTIKSYIDTNGAFSGSAAKWTTARTLTIGSTGKSVDGSGNVSWSLSEIGAAAASHTHNLITRNDTITYGASRLQWFDLSGNGTVSASTVYNPSNDWYHHIMMNHSNGNGYYVDLAICFHSDAFYYKRISAGVIANQDRNNGWVRVIDSSNIGSQTVAVANDCRTVVTTPSGQTEYALLFAADPSTSENNTIRKSPDIRINYFRGAANTEGISELVLGNNTAYTAANNSTARIALYNARGYYSYLYGSPQSVSGNAFYLPGSLGGNTILSGYYTAIFAWDDGTTHTTKPWKRILYTKTTTAWDDRDCVFMISYGYVDYETVIAKAHLRTNGSIATDSYSLDILFETPGFNRDKFRIVYTNNSGNVVGEVWFKNDHGQYASWKVTILSSAWRNGTNDCPSWEVRNNTHTGTGEGYASYTTGTGNKGPTYRGHTHMISANGYWGMMTPDGATNAWIRTTSLGIIPYQSGNAGSGHQSIGTSTWYFLEAYIDNVHGTHIGSVKTAGGDIQLTTPSSSSNDSGDIIFRYGNGNEKSRFWMANEYTAKAAPLYRVYNASGTQLYNGCLVLGDGTGASGSWNITAAAATVSTYINITAGNEIRFNVGSKPSSATDIYIGYAWSDGTKDAKINRYKFQNGNSQMANVQAARFESTSILLGDTSTQGAINIYNSNNKLFSVVASPDAQAGYGITLPPTGGLMTDIVYKASSGTYGALGKVENTGCIASLTASDISSHTSRSSSTQSFGGTYTIGNTWYNMLSIRHRNGSADGGSYGFYLRNSLTSSSSLVYNQQYNGSSWRGEATIVDSLNVSSYAVPNTEAGMSSGINKLSTGDSDPQDNDYYVAQYAGGGTATTSYHRRKHSSLFSYIKGKLYKILWSGSTSCTARSSTSITLTTAISANKYRFIKVVWNCGSYTGISEFRADTLNVTNNIPSGSDATTTNMIQFKIASDGKSVSVGPGTAAITVIQIAGVYPI